MCLSGISDPRRDEQLKFGGLECGGDIVQLHLGPRGFSDDRSYSKLPGVPVKSCLLGAAGAVQAAPANSP